MYKINIIIKMYPIFQVNILKGEKQKLKMSL